MAVHSVADVLPGAEILDVRGEYSENWIPILRIERVRGADGRVLFDAVSGHEDGRVEAAVDRVNAEYLDLLLDLTGDEYLGTRRIEV